MNPASAPLRITPLNATHRSLKAKMVDFGGWDMPVAVLRRSSKNTTPSAQRVGVFDVSHMGEIEIRGPEALQLIDHVTTNAARNLKTGQAQYSGLLYEHGGFVDDILVHKVADDHYFLVRQRLQPGEGFRAHPRAQHFDARSNRQRPLRADRHPGSVGARDAQKLTPVDLAAIRYYWFTDGEFPAYPRAHRPHRLHRRRRLRNLCAARRSAARIWNEILDAGEEFGIKPCGLGARNTLRLEAKMALYGHEIDASITPLEADLGWIVKLDKGDFVGRDALAETEGTGHHAQADRI